MPKAVRLYVKYVDAVSWAVGLFAMYLIFVMMGILLYASFSKAFTVPPVWSLEMAQFVMAAYYLLGGANSLQEDAHVRMDLLYVKWSPRTRAKVDALTAVFLLFYLVLLLYGGISSTQYALQYNEQSYSAWAPYMAPIKIVMTVGIFLTLLQAISMFFKDLAAARGEVL